MRIANSLDLVDHSLAAAEGWVPMGPGESPSHVGTAWHGPRVGDGGVGRGLATRGPRVSSKLEWVPVEFVGGLGSS